MREQRHVAGHRLDLLQQAGGARVHLLKEPSGALKWALVKRDRLHSANAGVEAPIDNWEAQIATTTDGGKTFTAFRGAPGGDDLLVLSARDVLAVIG